MTKNKKQEVKKCETCIHYVITEQVNFPLEGQCGLNVLDVERCESWVMQTWMDAK